jgi:hypothetical protein
VLLEIIQTEFWEEEERNDFLREILKSRDFWKMCDKELIYIEFFKKCFDLNRIIQFLKNFLFRVWELWILQTIFDSEEVRKQSVVYNNEQV